MTRYLLLLLFLLGYFWISPAAATVYFSDSFENHLITDSSSKTPWDVSACTNPTFLPPYPIDGCNPIIDSTVAHTGTHSLRSDYDPSCGMNTATGACGTFYDHFHTANSHVFMRWWTRFPNDAATNIWNQLAGSKQMYEKTSNLANNGLIFFHIEPGDNRINFHIAHQFYGSDCGLQGGRHPGVIDEECVFDVNIASPPTPLNDGFWHCIETEVQSSTPGGLDGTVRVWQDGTLITQYTTVTTSFTSAQCENAACTGITQPVAQWDHITHYAQLGGEDRWIDDFAVGDVRFNDCGGGSSSPILPTTTVVNFTATSATVTGTQDATNPATAMRVCWDPNGVNTCQVFPISQFVGWPTSGTCTNCQGVLTHTWEPQTTFACVHAQDSTGAEDPVNFRCNRFQFVYYIDPDWTGTQTGASATPWTSLVNAWSTINTALATFNTIVYFSARQASADVNQPTTTPITLSRTDTSTNMLTLDGMSIYNNNDSAPSASTWVPYFTPTPTAPGWNLSGANKSKFAITASSFEGGGTSGACPGYITLRGLKVDSTGGGMNMGYIHDLIIEYSEISQSTGAGNVNLIVGPLNNGPGCGGGGPDNITIRYNYLHNSFGESVYLGASQPDPGCGAVGPGQVNPNNGATCYPNGTAIATGANYLVQGNLIDDCAIRPNGTYAGGQGDGIDVKDGHVNVRVLNNTIRCRKSAPTVITDGQGIAFESGTVIDGNYIENPGHTCISTFMGWNNQTGRTALSIRNNICVNVNSGNGHNSGIDLQSPNHPSETSTWTTMAVDNNSVFNATDACIAVESGNPAGGVSVRNNIMQTCNGGLSAASGLLTIHDYNVYFNTGSASIGIAGVGNFACNQVATSESHSVCADPLFLNTASPYADSHFKLQPGSPAGGMGFNLSGAFTNDYSNATRGSTWDIGAWLFVSGGPAPPRAPSNVTVR